MSVQAMAWAIEQRRVTDPTARHVLLCMANYADKKGRNVFCSAATLAEDTGLSERAVRTKRKYLEDLGVIYRGNQMVVAVEIARADQRPVNYDLDMAGGLHHVHPARLQTGVNDVHPDGVNQMHPDSNTGCTTIRDGVHLVPQRGAPGASEPSFNRRATDLDTDSDAPRDYAGSFEGQSGAANQGLVIGTAVGAAAKLLRENGYRVTSQHPDLMAAINEGVTLGLLLEWIELHPAGSEKSRNGSPAYILACARSQIAAPASVVHVGGSSHGNSSSRRGARPSRDQEISDAGRALDELEERERRDGR